VDPERRPDLIRLVYVSLATRPLSAEDLFAIAERSERNNLAASITGLLITQGPYFYGVMEGARRRVLARMEIIITDDRHHSLRILREEAVAERRFANWSFGSLPEGAPRLPDNVQGGGFIIDLSQRLG
jgi:hypothetical protein